MRHIVMTIVIVVVVTTTTYLRNIDAFSSMSTTLLRLVVLAAALPPLIAAFAWPPIGVFATAIVLLLYTLLAVASSPFAVSPRWADLGPIVPLLLLADVLAVLLAVLWTRAIRRAEEHSGLAEIRQALDYRTPAEVYYAHPTDQPANTNHADLKGDQSTLKSLLKLSRRRGPT